MKKILVLLFMAIFIAGISQSNEEMKFEKGKIIYNGDIIKLKKAKEIANEKSPLAFKHFKRAQLFNVGIITFSIPGCLSFGIGIKEALQPDYNPKYTPYRTFGLVCLAGASWSLTFTNRSIIKGIQVFNESN